MCGTSHKRKTSRAAYEGETIRFNGDAQPIAARPTACHSFPWWLLWLIWPLIGVAKLVVPAAIGSITAISQITVPLIPLVLIIIGVWLWRRGA